MNVRAFLSTDDADALRAAGLLPSPSVRLEAGGLGDSVALTASVGDALRLATGALRAAGDAVEEDAGDRLASVSSRLRLAVSRVRRGERP